MSKAAELAALISSQTALSDRSMVINGAMQVAQRATSSTSTGYCSLDRYKIEPLNMDQLAYTFAQDNTVPAGEGFSKSAKISITTAEDSVADNEIFRLLHRIEGQNMQRASWGTSSAKPLTLSFYVRSNVTGTYAVEFRMNAGGNNSLSKNYTINSADTWERKTITFPKNTSTNFINDNTEGCELGWYLAAGANFSGGSLASDYGANATNTRAAGQTANITSSSSNTWYITGIQLEVGEQATPFEHRSFHDELRRCNRYFERCAKTLTGVGQASEANCGLWSGMSRSGNSGNNQGVMTYQTKRTNPSISVSSAAHINGVFPISPFAASLSSFGIDGNAGIDNCFVNAANNASSAPSSDCGSSGVMGNSSGTLDIDAEL